MKSFALGLCLVFLCVPCAGVSQDNSSDFAERSVVVKFNKPMFEITNRDSSCIYYPSIVLDADFLIILESNPPVSVEHVFYETESIVGVIQGVDWSNFYLLEYPPETDIDDIIVTLSVFPDTEYCLSNFISYQIGQCDTQHEDNTEFENQWYLQSESIGGIGYCQAKNYENEYSFFTPDVGIVDGGILVDHDDFTITGDPPRYCRVGGQYWYDVHGTKVFSVLGSLLSNTTGLVGITNNAVFRSYALDCGNLVNWKSENLDAISNNDLVTTSQGFPSYNFNIVVWNVLKTAFELGVTYVAAGGNYDMTYLLYPARFREEAFSVTATDQEGEKYGLYNDGRSLDIAAPGRDMKVLTFDHLTGVDEFYTVTNGTSFSAPIVAGAVSMLMSVLPDYAPEDYKGILKSSCVDIALAGPDSVTGHGRLNIGDAMRKVCSDDYLVSTGTASSVENEVTAGRIEGTFVGFDNIDDGSYLFEKTTYQVLAQINDNVFYSDSDSIFVWGRSAETTGIADMQFQRIGAGVPMTRYIFNTNMCYVVDGSINTETVQLETYSYKLFDVISEEYVGQVGPASASEVVVQYGVIGKVNEAGVLYRDFSDETQMSYPGTPYSSVAFDYDNDGDQDLFITFQDFPAKLFENVAFSFDGVPEMSDVTNDAFGVVGVYPGLRGVSVADYDNDGDMDIFAASRTDACLYRNEYNYEFNKYEFTNVAAEENISAYASNSWAGVWGDYDRDNDVDLYIVRAQTSDNSETPTPENILPQVDYLLRNDVNSGGGFTNVSADAEGMSTSTYGTISASWCDVDCDNDIDLLVPSIMDNSHSGTAKIYINQDDGTFTEEFSSKFNSVDLSCVSGIHWQDLDNDTDFDVAFSIQAGNPSDQRLFVNNSGQFTESFTGLSMSSTGVRALDSDLDGKQDLLFLPAENTDTPRLLKNNTEGSNIQVADVTSSVGLNTLGRVDGAVVSDFNTFGGVSDSDGDLVINLANQMFSAGRHLVTWQGINDQGHEVCSGVYLVRMKAGSFVKSDRLMLVR